MTLRSGLKKHFLSKKTFVLFFSKKLAFVYFFLYFCTLKFIKQLYLKKEDMKVIIRFLAISGIFIMSGISAQAQFGERLGKAIKKTAEDATVRKAEQKTDQAVSKSIDKALDPNSPKDDGKDNVSSDNTKDSDSDADEKPASTTAQSQQSVKSPEVAYNKFDFVAGDEIIFEDNMAGEQIGEFPSKWDLVEGEAEIAKMNGENVIVMKKGNKIRPLMKDIRNYLGDVYTIEFDYWFTLKKEGENHGNYWIGLIPAKENWNGYNKFDLSLPGHVNDWYWNRNQKQVNYSYRWKSTSNENRSGNREEIIEPGNWVHISLSFNKRAMKIYVNENRIANIPNMTDDIGWLEFHYGGGDDHRHGYIRNFRIAKGAVPLYDRMMTDGKIITYGITFDIGKATIKPESMGEINRIVTLMTENPELKFSVEGHTDNTGNAANNQTLSDARSQAVVDKLIEMGVAKDRLKAAGKGQTSPIADNNTDEGRAKNRRVEFVKTN